MEPVRYHGATYVSAHLGTSLTSIHNWRSDDTCNFPGPAVAVTGISGARPVFGWTDSQLPDLRNWYAKRFKLDEDTAAQRWKAIDESLTGTQKAEAEESKDQCQGQSLLFTIPNQRNGEAA